MKFKLLIHFVLPLLLLIAVNARGAMLEIELDGRAARVHTNADVRSQIKLFEEVRIVLDGDNRVFELGISSERDMDLLDSLCVLLTRGDYPQARLDNQASITKAPQHLIHLRSGRYHDSLTYEVVPAHAPGLRVENLLCDP